MTVLPRAILFDLDETILSFGSRPLLLQEIVEEFGETFAPLSSAETAAVIEARFVEFWADIEGHRQWRKRPLVDSRREIAARAFGDLTALGVKGLDKAMADRFANRFHAYREAQIRFFPGALETIDTLRERGVRLALVTNGAGEIQRGKIERFDLVRRFDHIQIEGEHGFGKPEERAYRHAMQALGVDAQETWMVGDNLEWEVAAPQRLGIFAIWHDHLGAGLPPDSPVRPDRIIRSLTELLEPWDAPPAARRED
jgi:putative hydrolase of the HAD superfamily